MKNIISYFSLLEMQKKDFIYQEESKWEDIVSMNDIGGIVLRPNPKSDHYAYTVSVMGNFITLSDLCDRINSGETSQAIINNPPSRSSLPAVVKMFSDCYIPISKVNNLFLELDITFSDIVDISKRFPDTVGYPHGPKIFIRFIIVRKEDDGKKSIIKIPLIHTWQRYKQGIKEPFDIKLGDIEESIMEIYSEMKLKNIIFENIMSFDSLIESRKYDEIPGKLSSEEFLLDIGFNEQESLIISEWIDQNRSHINFHRFPFKSNQPIAGVFLGENDVAINSKMRMPKEMLLFLALHESKHADQSIDGDFDNMYFEPVVNGDMDLFVRGYNELEKEANDYAISSMIDLGFSRFVEMQERQLRSNELAGRAVYSMMLEDIQKTGAKNFMELIRAQVM